MPRVNWFWIVLAVCSVCAQTAPLPDSARLLPPDTLVMLTVDNVQHARAQLEKTRLYALYKDPAMQPFVERIKKELDRMVQEQPSELLRWMVTEDMLPQGRLLLAVNMPEGRRMWEGEPSLFALIQWGQHADQTQAAIEKEFRRQVDDGAFRQVERYRGHEIITLRKAPDASAQGADSPLIEASDAASFYYCF